MRLVTFSHGSSPPRLGAVIGQWDRWSWIVDLHAADAEVPGDILQFIDGAGGLSGPMWDRALGVVDDSEKESRRGASPGLVDPSNARLHPPLMPRLLRDFLAFRVHVTRTRAASGSAMPTEWDQVPAYYNGNHLNVVGPEAAIPAMRYDRVEGGSHRIIASPKLDYEGEVGFVLGRGGRDVPAKKAEDHLFGVTIFNDFSARDIQMLAGKIGMGPAPGKDWANSIGPCIVTRDEFGELKDQFVAVRVNGDERIGGRYHDLVYDDRILKPGDRAVWSFPEMVESLSRFQPIHAGEVWGSGTIPGCCEFEKAEKARYLNPGDRVEIEIEGIGVLANRIAPAL